MKNVLGSLILVAVATLIFSCTPQTKVTITVTPEEAQAGPGQVVKFVFTLTPDAVNKGELGELQISDNANFNETKNYAGSNSITDSIEYTVPNTAQVGDKITITFTAKDGKSGLTNTKSAEITVISLIPEIVILTDKQSTYVTTSMTQTQWFKLDEDNITLVNATSTDADIAFGYNGATNVGHVVLAPNNPWFVSSYGANGVTYSTDGKKATKIAKYTGNLTYDQLTKEAINALTVNSAIYNQGNGVNLVKPGDIIIFQTVDGRKGAIKVKAINPTTPTKGTNLTATMTVDIKYQRTASAS